MNQISRRGFLSVSAGVAGLSLAACGGGGDGGSKPSSKLTANRTGAMAKYGVGDQFKATVPLSFSAMLLSNANYPYKADWEFWSELTKRTNVTLQPTVIPASDYNQKRSVMVSAGNAPTLIPKTYHPDEEAYISGGAILPVSDYLDLMPNFQDKVAKWNLAGDLDQLREADGKFYLLPGLHQDVWKDYSLAIRTDILKQLNLQVPQTWDDLTTVLRTMKLTYPDRYPFSDRWSTGSTTPQPGANNLLAILGEAHGVWAGWSYQHANWNADAGRFEYTGATDQYKAMIQYLNTLVSEKLLDPESFTQSDDQARQKFADGQSFVISANAQELVNHYRKDIAKISGATVAKIPVPIGPIGAAKTGYRTENGMMISNKAKDGKDFVALMQFIDWLWYSDEGQMFAKWGVPGTTYTGSVDDGTFKLAPDVTWAGVNPSGTKNLQVDYGFFNGVFAYGGSTKLLDSQFPPEELEFQKVMDARKTLPLAPPAPLSSDDREQATLWTTSLKDYVDQETLKFILGKRPLSEWTAYVSELKGKNSDQYIKLVNQAYQDFKKNHG
ncbi:extracellular solute-binding protein family 1 [Catenulispora acidiphila DSM 44928]|uniref:Extracellular solute-binding protein family 1 n=1 Tax=Catenulispora acidiphila (strain DSM 44928 / JCM 14897 / NBRC 102108 / NRRL B-24433 / ID139908) TaxID=479433 RepID=C7QDC9_CATAD|nr:extracellular solute-binding protein [Catenulispora acidiphila]ACU72722.1 extracellular solute-binding protein family 1 [Catenulispora acidiphila DSM 44928]